MREDEVKQMDRKTAKSRLARSAFRCSCAAVALVTASGLALPAHAQRAGMIVENIPHMRPGMIVENIPHAPPPTMIVENIPHAPPATMIVENIPHAPPSTMIVENIPYTPPATMIVEDIPFAPGSTLIVENQPQAVAPPISATQAFQASLSSSSSVVNVSRTAARDTISLTTSETILNWAPLDTANSDDIINILVI